MNQSINTDSKNSKEPQQKYRLGTVSIKILGGLNRFYGRPTSPSASIMAQNIQLFGPRGGFLTHQWIRETITVVLMVILSYKIVSAMLDDLRMRSYCMYYLEHNLFCFQTAYRNIIQFHLRQIFISKDT